MNPNDMLNMKTNFGMGFTIQSILDENSELLKVNPLLADKEKNDDVWSGLDAQAAFLGPNLWGSAPDSDLKLEYVDLEEFLDENDLLGAASLSPPPSSGLVTPLAPASPLLPPQEALLAPSPEPAAPPTPPTPPPAPAPVREVNKVTANKRAAQDKPRSSRRERRAPLPQVAVKFDVSPAELALATRPGQQFDPQTHQFSDEELKPQPMCKKSKKQVVPDESKDQKYWSRRERNNFAAKRSRDARRLKENQIILRANFLEKENDALRETIEKMTRENERLNARVNACTCRH